VKCDIVFLGIGGVLIPLSQTTKPISTPLSLSVTVTYVANSASPPFGCYQITLLDDRGTCACVCVCVCVWTTWTKSL